MSPRESDQREYGRSLSSQTPSLVQCFSQVSIIHCGRGLTTHVTIRGGGGDALDVVGKAAYCARAFLFIVTIGYVQSASFCSLTVSIFLVA